MNHILLSKNHTCMLYRYIYFIYFNVASKFLFGPDVHYHYLPIMTADVPEVHVISRKSKPFWLLPDEKTRLEA